MKTKTISILCLITTLQSFGMCPEILAMLTYDFRLVPNNIQNSSIIKAQENATIFAEIRKIINEKKDPNALIGNKMPIQYTCYINSDTHYELTRDLLKLGANPNVQDPNTGDTPLHNAVLHRQIKTIRLLLRHGARYRQSNIIGNSPFDIANLAIKKFMLTESRYYLLVGIGSGKNGSLFNQLPKDIIKVITFLVYPQVSIKLTSQPAAMYLDLSTRLL